MKGKGYSRHEAILRSFTKTELIAICQTLYSFVDNAKVKELYKDFKYEELNKMTVLTSNQLKIGLKA